MLDMKYVFIGVKHTVSTHSVCQPSFDGALVISVKFACDSVQLLEADRQTLCSSNANDPNETPTGTTIRSPRANEHSEHAPTRAARRIRHCASVYATRDALRLASTELRWMDHLALAKNRGQLSLLSLESLAAGAPSKAGSLLARTA